MTNASTKVPDSTSSEALIEHLSEVVKRKSIQISQDISTLVNKSSWNSLPDAEIKLLMQHIFSAPVSAAASIYAVLATVKKVTIWQAPLKMPAASLNKDLLRQLVEDFIAGAKKSKSTKLLKCFTEAVAKTHKDVYSHVLASLVKLQDAGIARKEIREVVFATDARKRQDAEISDFKALRYLLSLAESGSSKVNTLQASYNHKYEDEIAFVLRAAAVDSRIELLKNELFATLTLRQWLFVLDEKRSRDALRVCKESVSGYVTTAALQADNKVDLLDFLHIKDEFRSGSDEAARSLLEKVKAKDKALNALLSGEQLLEEIKELKERKHELEVSEAQLLGTVDELRASNRELNDEKTQALQGKEAARTTQRQDIKNQAIAEQKKVIEKIFKAFGFAFRKVQSVDCTSKDSVIMLLSEVLADVDIRLVGRPDEVVTFNGSDHKWNLPSSASKGIVAEPGYVWATDGEEHSHEKALLVPIEE